MPGKYTERYYTQQVLRGGAAIPAPSLLSPPPGLGPCPSRALVLVGILLALVRHPLHDVLDVFETQLQCVCIRLDRNVSEREAAYVLISRGTRH